MGEGDCYITSSTAGQTSWSWSGSYNDEPMVNLSSELIRRIFKEAGFEITIEEAAKIKERVI